MPKPKKPTTKRGHKRLVVAKASDGTPVIFVDSNVGGHKQVTLKDGEVVDSTTHTRTVEQAARRSHKYSALGRAR